MGQVLIYTNITIVISDCGDVVAEWIAHGTLNVQVVGSNLSAASWLTMCSAYI